MLPRLAVFRSNRMPITHLVLVTGTIMKPLCIRTPVKNGEVQQVDTEVTCNGCKMRGWTRSTRIFKETNIGISGQYTTREDAARV